MKMDKLSEVAWHVKVSGFTEFELRIQSGL